VDGGGPGPALKKVLAPRTHRHEKPDRSGSSNGDEGHNRNRPDSLFIREIAQDLAMLDESREKIARILAFIHGTITSSST